MSNDMASPAAGASSNTGPCKRSHFFSSRMHHYVYILLLNNLQLYTGYTSS